MTLAVDWTSNIKTLLKPCLIQPSVELLSAFLCMSAGIEILFDLYNTTLQNIEVLKLEKRLDEELFYLRDAPQEYSTVPLDFESVPLPKGAAVPVNTIKVSQQCIALFQVKLT